MSERSGGRHGGGEDGAAILEALAATVVISVGVLAIGVLTAGVVRGNRESGRVATAALAVEAELELLRAGAPLNTSGDLAPGPKPPDVGGEPRFQGLDAAGRVIATAVAAGAAGMDMLRRWNVTDEASARCLRRVRVAVLNRSATVELASGETLINCP